MRFVVALLVLVACKVPSIELDGRRCPCVDGYICDRASETCVRQLTDADIDPDTPLPPDALGPFSAPQPITELNGSSSDDDPTATADLLELYFDSDRAGGPGQGDIWVSRRASPTATWDTPTLVSELASIADDTTPDVSADGLRMYFASDRATPGNRDLYITTRPNRASAWSAPIRVVELASPGEDGAAIETADRLRLVMASTRSGTNDLYVASRAAIGQPWGNPTPLVGLSSPAFGESQHHINATATVVYYTSTEGGTEHIWSATCAAPAGPCQDQRLLAGVNSATATDFDPWVSPDERVLLFASSRSGNGDLYMATR